MEVEGEYTLGAVQALLLARGWSRGAIDRFEPHLNKIAVFATEQIGFTHMARMIMGHPKDDGPKNTCAAGLWTSKLGTAIDATHTLAALTSQKGVVRYGDLEGIYSRPRPHNS